MNRTQIAMGPVFLRMAFGEPDNTFYYRFALAMTLDDAKQLADSILLALNTVTTQAGPAPTASTTP